MEKLNVKYKEQIYTVLKECHSKSQPVNLRSVFYGLKEEIANEHKPGSDIAKTERDWRSRIGRVAKALNITTFNLSPNYFDVIREIIGGNSNTFHGSNDNNNGSGDSRAESSNHGSGSERDAVSSKKSVKGSKSKSSSTSSNSSDGDTNSNSTNSISSMLKTKISEGEKANVVNLYKKLNKTKMMKLSTDKVVEEEMMKMAGTCQYEHPCHSFILDTEDTNWLDNFTEEEIQEIKSTNIRELPTLPIELSSLFDSIKQSDDMSTIHKQISQLYFEPLSESGCHWAKHSMRDGVELHMSNFFQNSSYTERDLMSRIWRVIITAFDFSSITVREEVESAATKSQMNKKRKLSASEPINRKLNSKVPDQIMRYGSYEIGITEGAKIDDENGDKFLYDAMVKAPKLMKNMMCKLVEVAPHKKTSLRVVGLITSRFDISMMVMDMLESGICRIVRTDTFTYPVVFPLFVKEIRSCLELIWLAKLILEETVVDIVSPAQKTIGFKSRIVNLPTLYPAARKK